MIGVNLYELQHLNVSGHLREVKENLNETNGVVIGMTAMSEMIGMNEVRETAGLFQLDPIRAIKIHRIRTAAILIDLAMIVNTVVAGIAEIDTM